MGPPNKRLWNKIQAIKKKYPEVDDIKLMFM